MEKQPTDLLGTRSRGRNKTKPLEESTPVQHKSEGELFQEYTEQQKGVASVELNAQEQKIQAAAQMLQTSAFLKPLLFEQDVELMKTHPETEGYIRGYYTGTIDRVFTPSENGEEFKENESITDIGFDGLNVNIMDNDIGYYRLNDPERDPRIKKGLEPITVVAKDIEILGKSVANKMGGNWNTQKPILDLELGHLRTNFMHNSVAPYGVTMAIRVSRPTLALKSISDVASPEVEQLLSVFMKCRFNLLISGATGSGKALTNSTIIPTPKGDRLVKDIKVGDYVCGADGKPKLVERVHPQGEKDVYKVTLKDGRTVLCCNEHLWKVLDYKNYRSNAKRVGMHGDLKNYKVLSTQEMIDTGVVASSTVDSNGGVHNLYRYRLPQNSEVDFTDGKDIEVPYDPYLVGALLSIGTSKDGKLALSTKDEEVVKVIAKMLGSGYTRRSCSIWDITEANADFLEYDLEYTLDKYKYSSIAQRKRLLVGILDSVGAVYRSGGRYTVRFNSRNKTLIKFTQWVGRSLGLAIGLSGTENTGFTVTFNVPHQDKADLFSLKHKKEIALECKDLSQRKLMDDVAIISIEKLDYKEEMTCFTVSGEEHVFLANDFVVTHNTEFQKKLIGFIPDDFKITLMEDTLDSHIKLIYPEKDINSWVTRRSDNPDTEDVDFLALLRSALRNFPDYAMISEVRGAEANALLSVALSGHSIMTTLHANGGREIPARLTNMVQMANPNAEPLAIQRDIISVLNLGMHLERDKDPFTGRPIRYVKEIYEYVDFDKERGIIGYPLYEQFNSFDHDTQEYRIVKKMHRMSDMLKKKIEDCRLLDEVPYEFVAGTYNHKTMQDRIKELDSRSI